MQHELFSHVAMALVPEQGRREPRLWVRCLRVWSEPGRLIRSLDLRPGLNIVWSPDADAGGNDPIGHGGGKTTFCRMLRYCLAEDTFSPEDQRKRILEAYPKGMVGAEVMINGTCWAVVRPFGRQDPIVVKTARSLDDAFDPDTQKSALPHFKRALAEEIVGPAGDLMPSSIHADRRWEAVLAWMTRDQECRLRHHFEWRDPDTDSHSPVGGRSKEDILAIVRASIGALTIEEIEARSREEAQSEELSRLKSELNRIQWQILRTGAALNKTYAKEQIAASEGSLDLMLVKKIAEEWFRAALELPTDSATELFPARADRDRAAVHLRELEDRQTEATIKIESITRTLSLVRAELPKESAELDRNKNPVCPICKVPLDAALTSGCQLAKECDLDELQERVRAREAEIETLGNDVSALRSQAAPLKAEIALARQVFEHADRTVSRLEQAAFARSREIRDAERNADEIRRHEELVRERDDTAEAVASQEEALEQTKHVINELRQSRAAVIRDLSVKFDGVIRDLVPGGVSGQAVLDGRGLSLKVEFGGDRSTAAIESWKIVAFDIAALAMTIEGNTSLPGFLLHDSPREADLGFSLYERLFRFIGKLEAVGPAPLFQYILTTTTEPPKEFRGEPWLKMQLRGAPANERFLRVDL